jgi:hypothetical protein
MRQVLKSAAWISEAASASGRTQSRAPGPEADVHGPLEAGHRWRVSGDKMRPFRPGVAP